MRTSSVAFCALAIVMLAATARAAPCPNDTPGKYPVKIESSPPGASVYINDKSCLVGTTPWSGKFSAGDNAVVVELAGYEVANRTFKVARSRKAQSLFV